jgi:hypothetical protein
MREANTGCPSVGLAPMTMMTSAFMTESNACVPADSPSVLLRPYPVGEWHTRAHVSTLLLPNAARTSFCTRYVSSLVQRDDVMPPIESLPYVAWRRLNSAAA